MKAYDELREEKQRIEANLVKLQEVNSELNDYFNSLKRDPDIIRLEARSLGLLAEDEMIVLGNFPEEEKRTTKPGAVITYSPDIDISRENKFRLIAFIVFVSVLLCSLLFTYLRHSGSE